MNNLLLSNGVEIPSIGYGTWNLENNVAETVKTAFDIGYRSIDAAYSYGNDFYVGKAIKNSGIPREDLFITNKVWKTFYGKDLTIQACKKSLKFMKLDYFDLYLIHWPVPINQENWAEINSSTWEGMEALYKEGLVRSIGLSNFLPHHIDKLYENGLTVEPMVNQIEFHPGKNQTDILEYCTDRKIVVEGWSPLGRAEVLNTPVLMELSKKYECTTAQLCLKWSMQKGIIPIPRSSNPDRMRENFSIPDFSIQDDDCREIDKLTNIGCSVFIPDVNIPD